MSFDAVGEDAAGGGGYVQPWFRCITIATGLFAQLLDRMGSERLKTGTSQARANDATVPSCDYLTSWQVVSASITPEYASLKPERSQIRQPLEAMLMVS